MNVHHMIHKLAAAIYMGISDTETKVDKTINEKTGALIINMNVNNYHFNITASGILYINIQYFEHAITLYISWLRDEKEYIISIDNKAVHVINSSNKKNIFIILTNHIAHQDNELGLIKLMTKLSYVYDEWLDIIAEYNSKSKKNVCMVTNEEDALTDRFDPFTYEIKSNDKSKNKTRDKSDDKTGDTLTFDTRGIIPLVLGDEKYYDTKSVLRILKMYTDNISMEIINREIKYLKLRSKSRSRSHSRTHSKSHSRAHSRSRFSSVRKRFRNYSPSSEREQKYRRIN